MISEPRQRMRTPGIAIIKRPLDSLQVNFKISILPNIRIDLLYTKIIQAFTG